MYWMAGRESENFLKASQAFLSELSEKEWLRTSKQVLGRPLQLQAMNLMEINGIPTCLLTCIVAINLVMFRGSGIISESYQIVARVPHTIPTMFTANFVWKKIIRWKPSKSALAFCMWHNILQLIGGDPDKKSPSILNPQSHAHWTQKFWNGGERTRQISQASRN